MFDWRVRYMRFQSCEAGVRMTPRGDDCLVQSILLAAGKEDVVGLHHVCAPWVGKACQRSFSITGEPPEVHSNLCGASTTNRAPSPPMLQTLYIETKQLGSKPTRNRLISACSHPRPAILYQAAMMLELCSLQQPSVGRGVLPASAHPFRLRELALLLLSEGTKLARRPNDIRDCCHLTRPDADTCSGASQGRQHNNHQITIITK